MRHSNQSSVYSTSHSTNFTPSPAKPRKSLQLLSPTNDFWGTMPYYVLSNRIRLLSIEVKKNEELNEIFECLLELLKNLIENFEDESKRVIKATGNKFKWIQQYEQGEKLLRVFGLNYTEGSLFVMNDVTKSHIENKLKEFNYAAQRLNSTQALFQATI